MQTRITHPGRHFIILLATLLVIGLLAAPLYAQDTTPEPSTETPIPTEITPTEVTPPATDTPVVPTVEATAPEIPTVELTEQPTEVPTEIPTETPTEIPTEIPSETPSETATAEPTVELPLAYSTNFDAGFPVELGSGSGWLPVTLDAGQAVQYSDGADAALYTLSTFTDSAVESKILLNSGDVTLTLRKTAMDEYRALLSSDGALTLYKNAEMINTGTVILTPGTWITLKFSAVGGGLSALVDGVEIVNATDLAPLPSGQAGFSASPGTMVRVDDFAVYGLGTLIVLTESVPVVTPTETPAVIVTAEATTEATAEATSEATEEAPLEVSALSLDPNVPTNIVLTGNGTSVDITWDDTNLDETGYEIERYVSDAMTGTIGMTAVDIVAFTEPNVGCGLTLWYRVRAVRSSDSAVSDWSDWMSVTTAPCTAACDNLAAVQRVSAGSNSTYQTNGLLVPSGRAVISNAGNTYIVFGSGNPLENPTSELAGENNVPNVPDGYFYVMQNCTTYKFSMVNGGAESAKPTYLGSLDYFAGTLIGFDSTDPNLTSNDGSPLSSVFITDGNNTLLVSLQTGGSSQIPGNTKIIDMVYPYILMSTDGDLTGLFGGSDTNNANDLVVYNHQTQTLSLVTFGNGGGNTANAGSSGGRVFIADDSTPYVLFNSNASNLISGADSNGVADVFLRNMSTGATTRISLSDTEGQLTTASVLGGYSAVGMTLKVAFESRSRENGSASALSQVLLRTVSLATPNIGTTSLVSRATGAAGAAGTGASSGGRVSGDGRWVVFTSAANNLVAGDSNNAADVFVRDLTSNVTQRVSKTNAGAMLTKPSTAVDISPDGKTILFSSADSTIVTDDTASVCETDLADSNPALAGIQYDYNDNCVDLFAIGNPLGFTATPTGLAASTTFNDKIRLTWAAVSSVQGFTLEYSFNNGTSWEAPLTINNGAATSYDFAIACSVSVMFRLSSFVATPYPFHSSPAAATGNATNCTGPVPQAPTNGAYLNTATVNLSWSKPHPDIYGYDLDVSTTPTFTTHVSGYPANAVTEGFGTGTLPDGTYYWRVRTNAPGTGNYSVVSSFIIDTVPLTGVPTLLTPVSNNTVNTIRPTFTWSVVAGAAYYQLEINPTVDFSAAAQFVSPDPGLPGAITTTTYTLPVDLPQGVYYWRVRAYDPAMNPGSYSMPGTAFKADLKKLPANSAVITLVGASPTAPVMFTWAGGVAGTTYQVELDTNNDGIFPDETCPLVPTTALTCTQSFVPGWYAWRVLVNGEIPVTSHPARSFIVTPPLLSAPSLVSPSATAIYSASTPIQWNNLDFEWGNVAGAATYTFEIDNTPTFSTMLEYNSQGIIGTTITGVDMSTFPAGTYYWRVKAVNSLNVAGTPSAARKFVIDITPPASAPLQTLPADGAVVNTVRPTFTYTPVTDPSTPITYQVDVSTSLTPDFDTNIIANAVSTATTVMLPTNLPAQGTFYWRVRAYDRASNSSATSAIRSFTANISNLPAANAVVAPGNLTFTWATVPTATAYYVEIDDDGNGDFTNGTLTSCTPIPVTATTCTLARTAGTYPWRVVVTAGEPVVNNLGAYRVLYVKAGAGLPAPTNVHLDAVSGVGVYDTDIYVNAAEKAGGINVAWNAPAAVAGLTVQKYVVEFSPTSAFTSIMASVETPDGSTTQALIPASALALDGTNKYARVRAVYNPGTASSANTPSFWYVVDTQSPTAPTLLTPAVGQGSKAPPKAKLTWSAVTGIAPTNGYRLSVATNFSITTPVLPGYLNFPVTTASYTFPVDLPLGSLFWRMNAVDVAGNVSLNSSTGDFQVFLGSAPAQASVNQLVRPTFKWTPITGATNGYTLEIARDGDTSFTGDVYTFPASSSTLSHVYPAAQPALGSSSSIIYWRVYPTSTTPPAGYYASFAVTGGLTAPTLNLGDTVINLTEYPTAQLSWNAALPVTLGVYTYRVEVASNSAFTGAVSIGHFSASNATTLNLSPAMDSHADGLKYWRVRAEYQPGNIVGPYSATGTFTLDKTAPAKPTGLKVTFGTNPARPTLGWNAVTGIAATYGYQIDLSENSSFTTHVTGFPKSVSTPSSAIVAPLTLDQKTYYFVVRAMDAEGNVSPDSDTFTFSVNIASLPANNAVVNAPTGTVNQKFSWYAVPGATSYRVQVDTDNDGDFVDNVITCPAAGTTTALNCTLPGLARGTYIWRVLVNGGVIPGADIERTLFVLNSTVLSAPGNVRLSETGSIAPYYQDNLISEAEYTGGVNLEWTLPTVIGASVAAYDVQYSTTPTFTTLLASDDGVVGLSTPVPSIVLDTDGVKYVRVRARYQTGVTQQPGAFTAAKLFTVDTAAPGVPILTAPINGNIIATRTPTLTWKPVTGATRYQVQLFPFSGPPAIIDTQVATTSLIVPNALGLENATYFWMVTAYDAAGNAGIASVLFSFRVAAP